LTAEELAPFTEQNLLNPKSRRFTMPRKKADVSEVAQDAPVRVGIPEGTKEVSDELNAWRKKVATKKEYQGKVQLSRASEFGNPYHLRRPTGVPSLDLSLGGGFHAGGVGEVWGGESTGKTHLAYRTAGQVQENYGNDAYIIIACTELRVDKGFARQSGFCIAYTEDEIVEFETIRMSNGYPPFTEEEKKDLRSQIGHVDIITGNTGDNVLNMVLETLENVGRYCQLGIIESLGSLLTPEQDDKNVGEKTYGGSAGILTSFQNKLNPLYMLNRPDGTMLETTLIGINQIRANMDGGPYGPKTRVAAGSYAVKHGKMSSVELRKGQALWADAEHKVRLGHEVRWEIVKGKVGTHDGKKGAYDYLHVPAADPVFWASYLNEGTKYGINVVADLVGVGIDMGVLKKSSAWITWDEEGMKAQGDTNFAQDLVNAPELMKKLREECFRRSGISVRFK
jgi:RecA/RadA recombinase